MNESKSIQVSRPKALYAGSLFDGLLDCYVLDNGRRIVSQRGAVRALSGGRESGNLGAYLARLPNGYDTLTAGAAIDFVLPAGGLANGIEATCVADILKLYVDALSAGTLHPKQVPIACRAAAMLGAFAKVGIVALVDEATGFVNQTALTPPQQSLDEARIVSMIERMISPLFDALAAVTKLVSDASGCRISAADCSSLKRQVVVIAKMRAQSNTSSKGENSERRHIYNRLGAAVGWTGSGRRWDGLPASKVADAQALLREMHADAFRALPSTVDVQLTLSYRAMK